MTLSASLYSQQESFFGGDLEPSATPGAYVETIKPSAPAPVTPSTLGTRTLVLLIMADGNWRTLPQIATELKRRFKVCAMETAVSARVRELRKRGYTVECQPTKPGSSLYQYRATPGGAL